MGKKCFFIGFSVFVTFGIFLVTFLKESQGESQKKDIKSNELTQASEKHGVQIASSSAKEPSFNKNAIYSFYLGVYNQNQGNTIKAIEKYKEVLKLDPNNAEVHNNLGLIYKERDDLDKAVKHYQLAISLNPGMDEAHNNLGAIYYLRGDYRAAELEYQKALELNSKNLMSRLNMGLVYKAVGWKGKAIDTLEEVVFEVSFHPEAHYNLAILYEELGDLERAKWHYNRLILPEDCIIRFYHKRKEK